MVFFGLRFMSITVVLDNEPFSSFLILLTLLQPAKREAYSQADGFKPVERELIFDIVSEFQFSLPSQYEKLIRYEIYLNEYLRIAC